MIDLLLCVFIYLVGSLIALLVAWLFGLLVDLLVSFLVCCSYVVSCVICFLFVFGPFFIVMDVDVLICCVSLFGSSCCHLVWSRVGCAHVFEVTLVLAVVS